MGGDRRRKRREAERVEEEGIQREPKKGGRESRTREAESSREGRRRGAGVCGRKRGRGRVCGGGSTWGLGVGWGRPNFRNRGIRLLEQIEMDKGSKGNHCGIGK